MEGAELERLHNLEMIICDEVFRICKKYNLQCVLWAGSCLGAIRHKGFIPWDDDIDLAMPRKDYEKFKELAKTELNEKFFFQDIDTDKKCGLIFGKVRMNGTVLSENYSYHIHMHQGVWVDIFPYDKVSNRSFIRKKDRCILSIWKNIYIVKSGYKMPENRSKKMLPIYYITKIISKLFSFHFLRNRIYGVMTAHEKENTEYFFPYAGAVGERNLMPMDYFDDIQWLPFEDRKYGVSKMYNYYLTSVFGNYMELPPVEKRVGGLHFVREFKENTEK